MQAVPTLRADQCASHVSPTPVVCTGSALEEDCQQFLAKVLSTLTPLVALTQRGAFLVNACRLFGRETALQMQQEPSVLAKRAEAALTRRRDPNDLSMVGYRHGARPDSANNGAFERQVRSCGGFVHHAQDPRTLSPTPTPTHPGVFAPLSQLVMISGCLTD